MWELQVKGGQERSYEISAILKSNEFGHRSWGWGGLDKVILFSNGVGGNQLNPCTPERWERALKMASAIVDSLNAFDARLV